jgi:hypothetical protein
VRSIQSGHFAGHVVDSAGQRHFRRRPKQRVHIGSFVARKDSWGHRGLARGNINAWDMGHGWLEFIPIPRGQYLFDMVRFSMGSGPMSEAHVETHRPQHEVPHGLALDDVSRLDDGNEPS